MSTVLVVMTALSLGVAAVASVIAWRVVRDERRRSEARVRSLAAEIEGGAAEPVVSEADTVGFPIGAAAAVFAVVVAATVVAVSLFPVERGARNVAAAVPAVAPATNPASPVDRPLELVALSHDRSRTAFTVRGIVRNPPDGRGRGPVAAFVQLYDDRGDLVTSARAPIESAALPGGGESPFVIVVPGVPQVERYRVSFRASDAADNVIPHVDRRAGA